jgi:hypothetical protein
VLEIFLQMNKRAGGLDQALEKICIRRFGVEPELLQDIVRFIVTALVPALKISAVKWMLRWLTGGNLDVVTEKLADELRNPLAFVHGAPNLIAAQTMGKRRPSRFAEDERAHAGARGKQ